jgi:hypothetical protein
VVVPPNLGYYHSNSQRARFSRQPIGWIIWYKSDNKTLNSGFTLLMILNQSPSPGQYSTDAAQIHNLPRLATPFIGRVDELIEIDPQLIDPGCRLLTLVGPGGGGKTRLDCQGRSESGCCLCKGLELSGYRPRNSRQSIFFGNHLMRAIKTPYR